MTPPGHTLLNLLLSTLLCLTLVHGRDRQSKHWPFSQGDPIAIQCPLVLSNGSLSISQWGPGPLCVDTTGKTDGTELSLSFNSNTEFSCPLLMRPWIRSLLAHSASSRVYWTCRVPISKTSESTTTTAVYIPLVLPFWTVTTQQGTVHVMGRVHFILHSMDGFVIAAGAYSVKDHEYIVSSEEIVPVHGSIRWFVGHTFDPVATDSVASVDDLKKGGGGVYSNQLPKASDLVGSVRPSVVVMWVLVSATVSVGLCALLYEGVLKPRIVREAAKRK